MNTNFKRKNVLIIGSNGLIGRSLTNYLERENHVVFKIDLVQKFKQNNFYTCDITKENSVKKTISKITKVSKIDVVFNAASANPKVQNIKKFKFTKYPLKVWKKGLEVDLIGSFNISKYILRHFEKLDSGKIINISSIYGVVGPDQDIYFTKRDKYYGAKPIEYSVAKAGIIGFTKALASFYKNSNIEVFSLILAGIEEGKQNANFKKKYKNKLILGRLIKKGEYNSIINYLISHKTPFISGSSIDLSAGAINIL
tara:strand:+ start:106 stop:870 length:765 start_codon:yes stop_codon:yes gene_type:complete